MNRWLRLALALAEAAFVLAVVYFEPTYGVRGALHGEAFYDGRPTSYWRDELERWDVKRVTMRRHSLEWCGSMPIRSRTVYTRRSTWFEQQQARLRSSTAQSTDIEEFMMAEAFSVGPKLLHSPDAAPVLHELLEDRSPKVRLFAQIGLGMN